MSAGADFLRPNESSRLADGRLAQATIAQWHDVRLRATHGILIALDMESLDQMRKVVEQTSDIPGIVGYKVGLTVTLRLGLGGADIALGLALKHLLQHALALDRGRTFGDIALKLLALASQGFESC